MYFAIFCIYYIGMYVLQLSLCMTYQMFYIGLYFDIMCICDITTYVFCHILYILHRYVCTTIEFMYDIPNVLHRFVF